MQLAIDKNNQTKEPALPTAIGLLAKLTQIAAFLTTLASCTNNQTNSQTPAETELPSCCSLTKETDQPNPLQASEMIKRIADITQSNNPPTLDRMVRIPDKTIIFERVKSGTVTLEEVNVPSFLISTTETTNAEFARFVEETGYITLAERSLKGRESFSFVFKLPDNYNPSAGKDQWWAEVEGANWKHPEGPGSDLTGRENHPVVHIALEDALAYCKWAGRELMTEPQFRAAGSEENTVTPRKFGKPDITEANFFQGYFPTNNSALDGFVGAAPVGSFKPNANKIYDLVGNVWEIVLTPYENNSRYVMMVGGSDRCAWEGDATCKQANPQGRQTFDPYSPSSHIGFRTVKNN